jgi:hypothetical protein
MIPAGRRGFRLDRSDLLVLAIVGGLSGCGGGQSLPDPGPDAGVDPTTPLATLTPADHQQLCDWAAGRFGGWGRSKACGGTTFSGPASQSSCEQQSMSSATCTETVGDLQDCINQVVEGCQTLPEICLNLLFDCGTVM